MAHITGAGSDIHVEPKQVLDTIGRHMLVDGFPIVVDLENSQGVRLKDKRDGRTYLDFFQFFASLPVGINHPKLTDPVFRAKIAAAAVNKPSNSDFYSQQMAEFVEAMDRFAIPGELPHMFLIEGGALAVENALKAAFDWKVQKNYQRGATKDTGQQVIHFREAFHGRSGYTMSLTNTDPVKIKYYPKFNWPRITNPRVIFPLDKHMDEVLAAEEKAKREIKEAIQKHRNDIAALIIEPVQGEGGDNHFRPEFLRFLREITEENEIIFVADEVQTGAGLTGKFWAIEHAGVMPDVIAFGKKLQVCGILASKKFDDVDSVFKVPSRINSTWGGNLTDMVRSTRYLQVTDEDGLVENARETGGYLQERLHGLRDKYPAKVTNSRGAGLMCAFDLPDAETRSKVLGKARELGLLIVGCGERSVRFRPPLNLTRAEVDEGIEILDRALGAAL
ncbi:MAG: L-lysine 6-transaminase [Candidatus Krumholzibacteria bacterium]|nr:L-lysine 6-transaminase [Candidatus Krumholzibacteria bacterium]MDH4335903.1 L-lysine 6-transaminase [Candidatus Krumholzibacteria bacterium]MDH5268521.1 L-lysine 6-transaminase [Candidatus Krumholzibacteria bacterium]